MKLHSTLLTCILILTLFTGTALRVAASDAAAPAQHATGIGTSFDHVNKSITSVILPLQSTVEGIFDYYVDPERIVNETGALEDGTTLVTANDDGVYFAHTDASADPAAVTYLSTSAPVTFEGRNSVDVDVVVKAQITPTAGGKDIALVTDEAALDAAAEPALLLTLTIGDSAKAIPFTGTSLRARIPGIPDNFSVQTGKGQFIYDVRTDTDANPLTPWNRLTLTLSGKTNEREIPEGEDAMTAPAVTLTWSIISPDVSTEITDCTLSANRQFFYIAIPDEPQLDLSLLTSITASQGSTVNTVKVPAISSDARYVIIPWEEIRTGITLPGERYPGYSIQFDIVYNGYPYTCTYAFAAN